MHCETDAREAVRGRRNCSDRRWLGACPSIAVQIPASSDSSLDYEQHFRPWNIDQTLLLPPNVRDFVPKDHVSRFIVGLVRESLDLKAIMGSYVSVRQPPFDPRMMVSLLLHGYASGLYSSRRIAEPAASGTIS